MLYFFFFSSRRRHTRLQGDWSSDVCSSDLASVYTIRRSRSSPRTCLSSSSPARTWSLAHRSSWPTFVQPRSSPTFFGTPTNCTFAGKEPSPQSDRHSQSGERDGDGGLR